MLRGETPPRSFTKDHRAIDMRVASVEELINAGILFCGTPDQVYAQIVDFCEYCGGMGNLLMMGQAGFLSHEDTVDNLTLFAREVLPRLKKYKQPDAEAAAANAKPEAPHHRPATWLTLAWSPVDRTSLNLRRTDLALGIAVVIKRQMWSLRGARSAAKQSPPRRGLGAPSAGPDSKGNAAVWRKEPEVFAPRRRPFFLGFDPDQGPPRTGRET